MHETMLCGAEGADVGKPLRVPVLALVLIAASAGCSRPAPPPALAPTPAPRIVYVVVTPTAGAGPDYRATVLAVPAAAATPEPAPTVRAYVVPEPTSRPSAGRLYFAIEDFVTRPPDHAGSVWFDGDVRNVGSRAARVKILVKAYSINGVLLDSKVTYPQPSELEPGARSHFRSYVDASGGHAIHRVSPEILAE